MFSATGSGSGKNKIDVLSFKQPKSKLFVTVKIVLGIVGSFTIEYEPVIYLHVERLYLYIKRIYSMYCYAVYCTSVCVNRYMKVQMMLTHAHNIPCPPRHPANRSRPQHWQTKTKHVHTQYTQSTVHLQFVSPPGGESMYSSPHLHVRSIIIMFSFTGQTKRRSSYFFALISGVERIFFCLNTTEHFMQYCVSVYSLLLVASHGINASCYLTLSAFVDTTKYSAFKICRQFSVHDYRSKMSVPGEESQPSRPASVGEYLYRTYISKLTYALLSFLYIVPPPFLYFVSLAHQTVLHPRHILYLCLFCYIYCNGSLSHGE